MLWLLFVTLLACLWLRSRQKSNRDAPPELPGGLPVIGHVHLIAGNSTGLWLFIKKVAYESLQVGGIVLLRFGTKAIYVVTDPDDCLKLCNTCLQKDRIYEVLKPWAGEGLITGQTAIWRAHRKLISPAFNQQVLDGFISIFNSQARNFVSDLSCEVGKGPFDHVKCIHRYALENIFCREFVCDLSCEVGQGPFEHAKCIYRNALENIFLTAFGINDVSDDICLSNEYLHATQGVFKTTVQRLQNFLLHTNFMFNISRLKKKQDKYLKTLHQISNTILKTKKENYFKNKESKIIGENSAAKFKPFMDLLVEFAMEKGAFNDKEIREETDTMIAAGHDTIAVSLVFATVMIGSYPHVQETIHAELRRIFGADGRDITKHDLSQLVYLEAVLKESMRFYPTVPLFARLVEEDVKLSRYTLFAGTTCFFLTHGIHRHPVWGPDAEEFKPERWLDPASLPNNPGAYAAFGLGKRGCIGKTLALMSMKITLAHLLRAYIIKGDHTKMVLKYDITLDPVAGHFIEIERRKVVTENTAE